MWIPKGAAVIIEEGAYLRSGAYQRKFSIKNKFENFCHRFATYLLRRITDHHVLELIYGSIDKRQ